MGAAFSRLRASPCSFLISSFSIMLGMSLHWLGHGWSSIVGPALWSAGLVCLVLACCRMMGILRYSPSTVLTTLAGAAGLLGAAVGSIVGHRHGHDYGTFEGTQDLETGTQHLETGQQVTEEGVEETPLEVEAENVEAEKEEELPAQRPPRLLSKL